MNFIIPEGQENNQEIIVSDCNTAVAYGSGLLPVFATPAMLALMEETAHRSIEKYLPNDYTSVGTQATISHIKATPTGMKVCCRSELIKIDGRRLTFYVEVKDEAGKVGEGTHERCIVEMKRFMDKL